MSAISFTANSINKSSPVKSVVAWYAQHKRWLKPLLILSLLLLVALMLSACSSYPGQDPPCTGANRNAPGCQNPSAGVKDDPIGGEWYIDWALKILRSLLSSLSIAAVQLGVGIFWGIYTNLASTDFLACGGGSGGSNPTCSAVGVFETVRNIAFIFFPMILAWKFFKGYFIGALIETVYENGISSVAKMLIGGISLTFLNGIITAAFGLSNSLFTAIIGGAESLSDLGTKVVGSGKTSGVGSVTEVVNLGLLMFITAICLVMATVFIMLGLVFFLRTILIFILFAVSPLAVVAGLTEEFRSWFDRWLQSTQAMLIAPIPVAICLALVKNFVKTIPGAHDNPAEFMLQMVYVIAFLAIGAILMFKIAGQVGGAVFGLTIAAVGFAVGAGVGAVGASLSGGSGKDAGAANSGKKAAKGTNSTADEPNNSSTLPGGDAAGGVSGTGFSPGGGGGLGGGAAAIPIYSVNQQQGQLLNALRGLQESMSASTLRTTQAAASGGWNIPFSYRAAQGVQNSLHWAGHEAGVSSPYLVFAPSPGSGNVVATESSSITWQRSATEVQYGEASSSNSTPGDPLGYPGPPVSGGDGGSGGAYLIPASTVSEYPALPRTIIEPVPGGGGKPNNQQPAGGITNNYIVDYGQSLPNRSPDSASRTLNPSNAAPMLGAGTPSTPIQLPGNSSNSNHNSAVPPVGYGYAREYLGEGMPPVGQSSNREYLGEGVPPVEGVSTPPPSNMQPARIGDAIPNPYGDKPPFLLPPPGQTGNNDDSNEQEQR